MLRKKFVTVPQNLIECHNAFKQRSGFECISKPQLREQSIVNFLIAISSENYWKSIQNNLTFCQFSVKNMHIRAVFVTSKVSLEIDLIILFWYVAQSWNRWIFCYLPLPSRDICKICLTKLAKNPHKNIWGNS